MVNRLFSSLDPDAAYVALTPAELEAFNAAYVPVRIEDVDVEPRSTVFGCDKARHKRALKGNAGNTLGTFWTEINWCHDKKKGWHNTYITDDGTGGETKTPGWRYKGTPAFDAGVVGTSRGWAQHWFEAKFLPDSSRVFGST
ncbi:hypothetical protein GCM10010124_16820 [Pilimelia terevasa]|uniref:Uncharacterized protein n=1 Tax=Pilimelia terevasa TaxID=53372 RepID=A0A8J3BIL9_9ACTN|nr:hypothetical protein GCM10010124_16820 [Pilimelia terevasa]